MTRPNTMCRKFAATATGLVATAAMLFTSAPALGAYDHSVVESTFALGAPCEAVRDIAVLETEELIYVACEVKSGTHGTNNKGDDVIKRFHLDGTPAPFSGTAPYISGNTLTGDPNSIDGSLEADYNQGPPIQIAVDNSSSVNHGRLIVNTSPNVDVFDPSGEWFAGIAQPLGVTQVDSVDVGPDGSIYAMSERPGDRVSKYNPQLEEIKRLYPTNGSGTWGTPAHMRVDSTGAIWVLHDHHEETAGGGSNKIDKFEADQFTNQIQYGASTSGEALEPFVAKLSPFYTSPLVDAGSATPRFDVDLTNNDLYVNRGNKIEIYSQGNASEFSYKDASEFGSGTLVNSHGVAVTKDHRVYAGVGTNIVKFGPGNILPDVHTFAPNLEEVGHTTATVRGSVELGGGGNITGCKFEYGVGSTPPFTYPLEKKCVPDPAESPPGTNFSVTTPVKAELTGLTQGTTYHYRLQASNASGGNTGIDRTVTPAFVLKVQTLPAIGISTSGATLKGSFDPDLLLTSYRFEYGVTESYGFSTPVEVGGSGAGSIEVGKAVTGLPGGRILHYRIVAINEKGTTFGGDRTFRTSSPPDVTGLRSSQVAASSAVLEATVNPNGYDTNYRFEYGTTPEYGQFAPAGAVDIGAGTTPLTVSQKIEDLQEGITYHFRVVAENEWGEVSSSDTTFDFAPPGCPNDHVRQQAGSSYLPDCRAYELVSPGASGGVLLFPSSAVWSFEGQDWPLNSGYASSPSRFAYFGGLGSINGLRPPNSPMDNYVATRTQSGWVTAVPGLGAGETFNAGEMECSESMAFCIDHNIYGFYTILENGGEQGGETAPYLSTGSGQRLGRLPTNLGAIPKGRTFKGKQRMSADFSHFVFSSTNVPFVPGALITSQGTAYDNDLDDQTVTVISKLANGENLPEEGEAAPINFPGLSADGTHVLMQTTAPGGLLHLYMRVNRAVTYDISRGAGVKPIGMTRDGSTVYFTTTTSLDPGDTDTSADLYMWKESGPVSNDELTRISVGNGQGNSNECASTYGAVACAVEPIAPERAHPTAGRVNNPGQDDIFAERSGDIYFYSPEVLDSSNPGIKNERNLYVYHDGAVHLVAVLDREVFAPPAKVTKITRMQISPDGSHAAMVTASRLTSYANGTFLEMYTYDPDTGVIHCASCNPTGSAPAASVQASLGGRFMADDGRAFFSTTEALVPRDTDGAIIDTYEYVGGRPQLISSGQGSRDFTGGSKLSTFLQTPQHIGLEAVSHDGQDVYFSTYETLLGVDHNGEFVKFYDARTGGGFPEDQELGPCEAADECHGVDSAPPPAQGVATGGELGSGGNAQAGSEPKKKKKKTKRSSRSRRHKAKRHTGARHG